MCCRTFTRALLTIKMSIGDSRILATSKATLPCPRMTAVSQLRSGHSCTEKKSRKYLECGNASLKKHTHTHSFLLPSDSWAVRCTSPQSLWQSRHRPGLLRALPFSCYPPPRNSARKRARKTSVWMLELVLLRK